MRDNPDGSVLLYKPGVVRADHLMRMTNAPGWDKGHVDSVFQPGVRGSLRFTIDDVQYDIGIEKFRSKAFIKEVEPHGEQYHCERRHYGSAGLQKVSPKRMEESAAPAKPVLPKRMAFGEWVPCPRCKGVPKDCKDCGGAGYVQWQPRNRSGSATS